MGFGEAGMKIVWYNVLRGFHNKEKDGSFTLGKERLDAVKKVIKDLNPDVFFVGEGDFNPNCKISGPKIKTIDYQKEFGFPFVYYSETDATSRKGEVILSKMPVTVKNLSGGGYSTSQFTDLRCSFVVDGKKINLDVIHPYPTIPEAEKARLVGEILDKKENPYILLGDYNALSPKDKYDWKSLAKEYEAFQGSKEKAEANAKDTVTYLMVKRVIAAGLVDTYYEHNDEYSCTLPTKKYAITDDTKRTMRIDYIFCSEDFKVLNSGIVKNKLTDMASDHYPIFAELELK